MQYQRLKPFLTALSWLPAAIVAAPLPTLQNYAKVPVDSSSSEGLISINDSNTPNTKALTDYYDTIPDIATCYEGVLKETEKQKALKRLNVIRAFSGLRAVTYDYASDIQTAKSALIIAANMQVNHYPPTTYLCYTTDGYNGSGTSNLAQAAGSAATFTSKTDDYFIKAWLVDNGIVSLGHRRWVLDPFLPKTSFGRVDGTNTVNATYPYSTGAALKVSYVGANISTTAQQYVAYPIGSYPSILFTKTWYMSFSVLSNKTARASNNNVSFANSTVSVTKNDGTAMAVTNIAYDNVAYGLPNSLQWKVTNPVDNVQYNVHIGNVLVGGQPIAYDYQFTLITDASILTPAANTHGATSVTANSATLNGIVNDNDATTTVTFDFGTTTNYGTSLAATPGTINAGTGTQIVTANPTGLIGCTTYHYRVKAVSSAGTNYGSDQTFITTATPDCSNFLAQNNWTLIGVPYNTGSNTVADVFGDDITTTYGTNWQLYRRDEATKTYVQLNATDTLTQGNGYWIFSDTVANLDTTGTDTPVITTGNCITGNGFPNGCFAIPLTASGSKQYNLVSHPFPTQVSWGNVRFEVTTAATLTNCTVGSVAGTYLCTPSKAELDNIASKVMWQYNGSAFQPKDDVTAGMVGTLTLMQGFWVKTLAAATGNTIQLLIPKP